MSCALRKSLLLRPLRPRCARPPPPVRGRNLAWLFFLYTEFLPARGRWRAVAHATSDGRGRPHHQPARSAVRLPKVAVLPARLDPGVRRGERQIPIHPRFRLHKAGPFQCLGEASGRCIPAPWSLCHNPTCFFRPAWGRVAPAAERSGHAPGVRAPAGSSPARGRGGPARAFRRAPAHACRPPPGHYADRVRRATRLRVGPCARTALPPG